MGLSANKLTKQIVIGMIAGAVIGLIINFAFGLTGPVQTTLVDGVFDTAGTLFIRMLKMLIVPLVLVSLVCGAASLADPSRLGKLGGKTLVLYLMTTAIAISFALVIALVVNPGKGKGGQFEEAEYIAKQAPTIKEVLLNIVPENPIAALAQTEMLQIIFFALLLGIALTMTGEAGQRIKKIFDDLNEVVMQIVVFVMVLAPYGVFALMVKLFAQLGFSSFALLLDYFLTVFFVLLVQLFVTYPLLVRFLAGQNPMVFLRKMRAAQLFAFSTASSNATIPVTLRTVKKRLGVDNEVASFTVPLGATINMDGTAIMQGIATIFIANVYSVDLTLVQLLTVVLMATMASIGAAGVPGVGLILLATVLSQVGLPVEGIGLILGIDRLLDMTRTAVNITGDAAVTTIVAKSEQDLDLAVYDDPNAGEEAVEAGLNPG